MEDSRCGSARRKGTQIKCDGGRAPLVADRSRHDPSDTTHVYISYMSRHRYTLLIYHKQDMTAASVAAFLPRWQNTTAVAEPRFLYSLDKAQTIGAQQKSRTSVHFLLRVAKHARKFLLVCLI